MILVKTDTVIRNEGMKVLIKHLGKIDAERFISLILREPFDYTKWQKDLWKDKTVKEISEAAMEYRRTDSI
ncbi:hypothetical protein [Syntrophomonas wolfei]|jgi:hypothetical protein|uniref:hypothetical protein n=1 Tax=Syntrophomonas wolfei TaxID=863 RepID=UPI0023F49C65|nr:hypothetical protein [Syntrophomonas wolfei]